MLPLQSPRIRSILCLGAHADDVEIGCGGTLLELLARHPGAHVHWVVLSACGQRADEAAAAAARFLAGAASQRVVLKSFRDSYFPAHYGEIKEFFEEIKAQVQPDLVFTHRREDLHQDHRVVAELTWCGFRNHVVLEYEIAKYEGDLGAPNVFVPLDESICRRKIDYLLESYPSRRTAHPWFTSDAFLALLRLRGIECNSPTGLAEALYARKLTLNLSPA